MKGFTQQLPIYCLMGPTASGKSELAIKLARQFPIEIISVDSAMVYRGMDIGTAKPSTAILKEIPHWLIDIRDPAETFSAADFCMEAQAAIENIFSRNKIPLLVGGTMLYFHALQQGLSKLPSADTKIRAELEEQAAQTGWAVQHERLIQIDPEAAARIHPNDSQRIQRALEVFLSSGKTLSAWQNEKKEQDSFYQFYNFALIPPDRKLLHEKIAQRFHQMLAAGLIDEVKALFARQDLSLNTPAIRSVGYRQVWQYLAGTLSYESMIEKAIIATRQLAKRQLTWLRGM